MVGRQKGFRTAADGIWEDLVFKGTWLGRLNRCSMANETLGWEMRSWGVMESCLRTDDLMGYEGLEPDSLGRASAYGLRCRSEYLQTSRLGLDILVYSVRYIYALMLMES